MRNVVITGIGVLSPIGLGAAAYWDALAVGKAGFRPITLFDTASFSVKIAGELADFDALAVLGKKGLRDLDRSTRLVSAAAKFAIEDGRLEITEADTHSTGVAVGTTFGSLHSISQFDRSGLIEGPKSVNPSHFPNTVINSPASQVSIRFKIKGFNTTISTGFCAGLDAVAYAADFIKLNRAEVVLAGGVEELCEETFMGFHTLGCLCGTDGSEPVCRPFDARRNGTILSEGAAILVVEDEKHALDRGATVLARVLGCGNAFDPAAENNFNHEGRGMKNAIELALQEAALRPEDIDAVCACANSTKGLDRLETNAIKAVFGGNATSMPVSAIKSMIGETYSASGAMALAAAVGAIQREFIPATINYKEKDPDCDLDYVPDGERRKKIKNVLVTAVDPFGQNSAIVVGRYNRSI
jgi:3-oxoacyl-[acyl-carrier-protein] synthase II